MHFIGAVKPWQHRYLQEVDAVILHPGSYSAQNVAQDYIKRWWQVYTSLEKVGVNKEWGISACNHSDLISLCYFFYISSMQDGSSMLYHHIPLSLSHQPLSPSLFPPSKEHGSGWGYGHTPLDPSSMGSTECDDEVANLQVSCDSHVTVLDPQALAPPTLVEGGGDAILPSMSDSVLTSPSPFPPNTPLLPPHVPTTTHPLKSTGYFATTGSQASVSSSPGTGADLDHRKAFEVGTLDVQGRDSFQNIQAHIDSQLEAPEDEQVD